MNRFFDKPHHFLALALFIATSQLTFNSHAKDLSAAFRPPPPATPAIGALMESLPNVFEQDVPESIEDLQAIESHVEVLSDQLRDATVCIQTGFATGSGVIISEDGYILTAAHVIEGATDLTFVFPDGSRARGVALGIDSRIDSGICRITDEGPWPHLPVGDLADVEVGDYVLSIGHPGGFDAARPYVVRLGRMLDMAPSVLQTDCALVGGDSGGPLFDMHGRVIGIHSRIAGSTNANYHVPIDTYLHNWDQLASGANVVNPRSGRPTVGIEGQDAQEQDGALLETILPGSPAEQAGLREGDIVIGFNEETIDDFRDFQRQVRRSDPGDEVVLTVLRNGEEVQIRLTIGRQ